MLNSLKFKDLKPELVNLTGVRLLVIFSLLIESPKSAEEINEYFEKNNYPKESFSVDTLRNDINALRYAGCEISRADKSNNFKYTLLSHPFELCIDKDIAFGVAKLYNKIYKFFDINTLIQADNLLKVLAKYTVDNETSEILNGISILKNVDIDILKSLIPAVERGHTVSFLYKAPALGKINFEFIPNRFEIISRKLYINGYIKNYNSTSFLPVFRILTKAVEYINDEPAENKVFQIVYELRNAAMYNFTETAEEKILEEQDDKIRIEYKSSNPFKIKQRILSYGSNCTILSPENIKKDFTEELMKIHRIYENE